MTASAGTEWVDHAMEALASAGYRSGGGRRKVVELLGSESCALSALEIDERITDIGRATVYRALEQLEELGLVQRLDVGADAAGYEKVDPGGHHHHHIVCERCGKVVPFEDPELEKVISGVSKGSGFRVSGHEVTLHGMCGTCGRKGE